MKKIISSASKIVFLLMAIATIAGLFVGKISGEQFLILTSMAFTYYFTRKSDNASNGK